MVSLSRKMVMVVDYAESTKDKLYNIIIDLYSLYQSHPIAGNCVLVWLALNAVPLIIFGACVLTFGFWVMIIAVWAQLVFLILALSVLSFFLFLGSCAAVCVCAAAYAALLVYQWSSGKLIAPYSMLPEDINHTS